MSTAVGTREIRPMAYDPEPAQRMGSLLAACRRNSMPWSDKTYARLVVVVTRDLDKWERTTWRQVFFECRPMWRAGYERTTSWRGYLDAD